MFAIATRRYCSTNWQALTQFTGDCYFQAMMGHGLRAVSQTELVDKLTNRGFLTISDSDLLKKIKSVDRVKFITVPSNNVYDNIPQKLIVPSETSHSMSTPQLHAQVLSLLAGQLGTGRTACEIGCGSGYLPAVMHALGTEYVFAIETDSDLLEIAEANLKNCGSTIFISNRVKDVSRALDAMYISSYFDSEAAMFEYLAQFKFNPNACVVAVFKDPEPSPIDQQLVFLNRADHGWTTTRLFRVLCEPMLV